MGSEDRKPSLEAPSLGFRRRRRKSAPEPDAVARDEPVVEPVEEPAESEPVVEPTVAEEPVAVAEPSEDTVVEEPVVEPETEVMPVREATVEEVLADETAVETPETPETTDDAPPAPAAAATKPSKPPRAPREPLNGHLAAALAGLVVGAFLVVGTAGGLEACERVRGTSSCGGGPGFLLLVAVVAIAVVLGTYLLRWAKVPSAGSISFLAVALVSVLSVLFLLDSLDSPPGIVVLGVLTIGAYLLSHWVTVRYIDTVE